MILVRFGHSKRRPAVSYRLRRGRGRAAFVALIAILLNLMIPMTHGALAAAATDEYLEICTQSGIKRVPADQLWTGDEIAAEDGGDCAACPSCPICWVGKATDVYLAEVSVEAPRLPILNLTRYFSLQPVLFPERDSFKPEARAPPYI